MSVDSATIVIADDDALVREACKAALERQGHTVLLAEDGLGAVSLVESRPVDAVLLDILMPRKEGLETLIELKRRFPSLKVFVMSGGVTHSKADFLAVAKKFGANGVLRKPLQLQTLLEILEDRQRDTRCGAGG